MANADGEAVDFEPEDDDVMDEEGAVDIDASPRPAHHKLRSAITDVALSSIATAPKKTKGRGFREETDADRNARLAGRDFDSLDSEGGPGAQRSIEGWIILVTGGHEEGQEDDLQNAFGEFGDVKNLHLHLDRRTGFVKDQKAHEAILKVLNLLGDTREPALKEWTARAELCDMLHEPVRIAMVGKYTGLSDSYLSVLKALLHASVDCCRNWL